MSDANVLYRMRDRSGALLYVGITMNVEQRFTAHRGSKSWWQDIATIELEHFATREDVEAAEAEAIRSEAPAHNLLRYRRARPEPTTPSAEERARVQTRLDELARTVSSSGTPSICLDTALWDLLKVTSKTSFHGSRVNVLRLLMRWYIGDAPDNALQRPTRGFMQANKLRRPQFEVRATVKPFNGIPAELWAAFREEAEATGRSAAVVLGESARWYLNVPDAQLPQRPVKV